QQQLERLEHLVTVLLEGTITSAETQELQELLSSSQSAQHRYVELMQDINSLRWWSDPASSLPPRVRDERVLPARRSRRSIANLVAGLAACIAILVGVVAWSQRDRGKVVQQGEK